MIHWFLWQIVLPLTNSKCTLPKTKHDNIKSPIWRCISYWKWGCSNVMSVFRVVIDWDQVVLSFYGFILTSLASSHTSRTKHSAAIIIQEGIRWGVNVWDSNRNLPTRYTGEASPSPALVISSFRSRILLKTHNWQVVKPPHIWKPSPCHLGKMVILLHPFAHHDSHKPVNNFQIRTLNLTNKQKTRMDLQLMVWLGKSGPFLVFWESSSDTKNPNPNGSPEIGDPIGIQSSGPLGPNKENH